MYFFPFSLVYSRVAHHLCCEKERKKKLVYQRKRLAEARLCERKARARACYTFTANASRRRIIIINYISTQRSVVCFYICCYICLLFLLYMYFFGFDRCSTPSSVRMRSINLPHFEHEL